MKKKLKYSASNPIKDSFLQGILKLWQNLTFLSNQDFQVYNSMGFEFSLLIKLNCWNLHIYLCKYTEKH